MKCDDAFIINLTDFRRNLLITRDKRKQIEVARSNLCSLRI